MQAYTSPTSLHFFFFFQIIVTTFFPFTSSSDSRGGAVFFFFFCFLRLFPFFLQQIHLHHSDILFFFFFFFVPIVIMFLINCCLFFFVFFFFFNFFPFIFLSNFFFGFPSFPQPLLLLLGRLFHLRFDFSHVFIHLSGGNGDPLVDQILLLLVHRREGEGQHEKKRKEGGVRDEVAEKSNNEAPQRDKPGAAVVPPRHELVHRLKCRHQPGRGAVHKAIDGLVDVVGGELTSIREAQHNASQKGQLQDTAEECHHRVFHKAKQSQNGKYGSKKYTRNFWTVPR
ncbi:hypothetical protein MOQ_002006 [Trypanosoma cruzi marinkellei]|uniref:Uncharacterized protein n=1 Tax=Trypanosoma cruzi marinkellei TaxID=85056 RepID=K2P9M0_TRYCR|nr:hypothetical protein MOQ_002006 [Trypanosoma cruzi marinkellei]